MTVLTRIDAYNHLTNYLNGLTVTLDKSGIFYSDIEKKYVVFNQDLNIEYKHSENDCLTWLRDNK